MTTLSRTLDILVIGAGQAGLAMGYHLKRTALRFQLVDQNARIGDSWRRRYDSLVLFTPRAYSVLPGFSMPGDPESYPDKDEFAAYLEAYAGHFDLPIALETGIRRLERTNGHFRAVSEAGATVECRAVVLATGAFQQPIVPSVSKQLAPTVRQYSPETYKNPASVPPGTVLVVGDGATGRDIAAELSADRTVFLATGRPRRLLPQRILGKSTWWWLARPSWMTSLKLHQ